MRVVTPLETRLARPLPGALFGYLLDAERAVVGAARSNAGDVVAWAGEVLRLDDVDVVAAATKAREPGGHGLDVDASLVTERSPDWPLVSTARVAGVHRSTAALDIVQALVEDAALGVAAAVEALEGWAGPCDLVLGGGAVRSDGWCHLLADVIGRPVLRSSSVEASARAALFAFQRLGVSARLSNEDRATVEPDPGRAKAFSLLKGRHRLFGASWGS